MIDVLFVKYKTTGLRHRPAQFNWTLSLSQNKYLQDFMYNIETYDQFYKVSKTQGPN